MSINFEQAFHKGAADWNGIVSMVFIFGLNTQGIRL
jgi:hypothetical protein